MIFIGNFNKNSYISVISVAKPKNFIEVRRCLMAIYAWIYILLTAMKQWSKPMKR